MAAATTTIRASISLHLFFLFFFVINLSCFASCSFGVESTTRVFSLKRRGDILNILGHYDLSNQPSAPLYPPLTNPVTNPTPPLENPAPAIPATNPVVGATPIPPPPPPAPAQAQAQAQAQGGAIPTANPVTNPVTTPAGGGAQPVTNPVTTPTPTLPLTTPPNPNPTTVNAPPAAAQAQGGAIPTANPVTTPAAGGAQPVTNPVSTPTPSLPLTTPPNPNPTTVNAPPAAAVPTGQSWCVAKSGLTQTSLQTALDYACGLGGADCSAIQQGGTCYNPITLQNHASFAFNSYYQKNPVQTSCDFGGTAMVTNQNPSTGSCVYPTSSASGTPSTMPTTTTTTTTTPSTMPTTTPPPSNGATVPAAGTDAPPNVLNSSTSNYPPLGGGTGGSIIGASPPADESYISLSNHLQAYVVSIALLASITTTVLISPLT